MLMMFALTPFLSVPLTSQEATDAFSLLESRGTAEAFLAACEASGLMDELKGFPSVTLLVPTDRAFDALSPGDVAALFEPEARGDLRWLLDHHVVLGSMDTIAMLENGVPTRAGTMLPASLEGGALVIGGARVAVNDLKTTTGFVHELQDIIQPARREKTPAKRLAERALRSAEALEPAGQAAVYEMALAAIVEIDSENLVARVALSNTEVNGGARLEARRRALSQILGGAAPLPMTTTPGPDATLLIPFDGSEGDPDWYTRNDDVMGGISDSRFERTDDGTGVFAGALSLENNGGFATIRSEAKDLGLEPFKGLRIRVKGDGREYGVSALAGDERNRSRAWRKKFNAPAGVWTTVDIPFEDMVLNIRGRRYPDVGPPERSKVRSFSFIIADKDESPFQLELDWIAAYR